MIWLRSMDSDLDEKLTSIKQSVVHAFKVGKLYSFNREPPKGKARQILADAYSETQNWIRNHGESEEALRLLALIQEAFTYYPLAINTLEELINKSPNPKREDLKRLAMCSVAFQEMEAKRLCDDGDKFDE